MRPEEPATAAGFPPIRMVVARFWTSGAENGMAGMRYSISDTAEYGDYSRGPRIVDADTRARMKQILADIQDGTFAEEWIAENREGRKRFDELRYAARNHPIEKVGAELRAMMPWISAGKAKPQDVSGG